MSATAITGSVRSGACDLYYEQAGEGIPIR
jgi:hypothetical protein